MRTVSASRTMSVPPERVWALVTDLPRMGEWSPENVGGRWVGGSTGAELGARVRGDNRNGRRSSTTTCRVVACDRPTRFAFDVSSGPVRISRWEYRIEPTDGGCTVTETWTDRRHPLFVPFGKLASGVADRETFNRASIETTLERIEAAATSAT